MLEVFLFHTSDAVMSRATSSARQVMNRVNQRVGASQRLRDSWRSAPVGRRRARQPRRAKSDGRDLERWGRAAKPLRRHAIETQTPTRLWAGVFR